MLAATHYVCPDEPKTDDVEASESATAEPRAVKMDIIREVRTCTRRRVADGVEAV